MSPEGVTSFALFADIWTLFPRAGGRSKRSVSASNGLRQEKELGHWQLGKGSVSLSREESRIAKLSCGGKYSMPAFL